VVYLTCTQLREIARTHLHIPLPPTLSFHTYLCVECGGVKLVEGGGGEEVLSFSLVSSAQSTSNGQHHLSRVHHSGWLYVRFMCACVCDHEHGYTKYLLGFADINNSCHAPRHHTLPTLQHA